jgi:CelD/BcsL family acetyltransferase involved in cellulose biosynthesis
MQWTFVHDVDGWQQLAEPWNALLVRAATDVPFLRHEYMLNWWRSRGGGEWPEAELWLGLARDERGALAGVAPFFYAQTQRGGKALLLLGSVETSDYLDLILPSEEAAPMVESLLAALSEDGPRGWDTLDLYNVPEGSPSLSALEAAAARHGWHSDRSNLQPCPVVMLGDDWEAYLARLDKKQRHELRRKLRRAEASPEGVRLRIVQDEASLEKGAETFLDLMAREEEKRRFLTPSMRELFRGLMQAAARHAWLNLAFLEIGGLPAAAYLSFDYAGRLWVYNSGFNPDFLSLSPGWVLLGLLIRWAIDHGRTSIDFLRGDEDYKFQLGGVERTICRLTVTR